MIKTPIDIIIPVYNEGEKVYNLLKLFNDNIKNKFRVLFCYDLDDDNIFKYIEKFQKSPDSTIKYFGCGKANKISHHYSEDSKKKHKGYNSALIYSGITAGSLWVVNGIHAYIVGPRPKKDIIQKWDIVTPKPN